MFDGDCTVEIGGKELKRKFRSNKSLRDTQPVVTDHRIVEINSFIKYRYIYDRCHHVISIFRLFLLELIKRPTQSMSVQVW